MKFFELKTHEGIVGGWFLIPCKKGRSAGGSIDKNMQLNERIML